MSLNSVKYTEVDRLGCDLKVNQSVFSEEHSDTKECEAAWLAQAQKMAHLGSWAVNFNTGRLVCSGNFLNILGLTSQDKPLDSEDFLNFISPQDKTLVERTLKTVLTEKTPLEIDHAVITNSGKLRYVHQMIEALPKENQNGFDIVGVVRDVTDQRHLELQAQLMTRVFEKSMDGIMVTAPDGAIQMVNPGFTNITGYESSEVMGKNPRILKSGKHPDSFYFKMWKSMIERDYWQGEVWNCRKNGEIYPVFLTISAIKDPNGHLLNYVGDFHDISEQKRTEDRVAFQTYHDLLTGLPNRKLFKDRLKKALAHAVRGDEGVAVMFLDLDQFKNINDTLGHGMGDLLIKAVAQRLKDFVREEDTVARLSGDDFLILLQDYKDPDSVAALAERILGFIKSPFDIKDRKIHVSASIGITIHPHDGNNVETLMANADLALYQAKANGGDSYKFFTSQMNEKIVKRMELQNSLCLALDRDEFVLYYQPKVDVASARIKGVEALMRWQSPSGRLAPPDEVIPLAEETGLIIPIGQVILEKACRQAVIWHEMGFDWLNLAVNLSPRQFSDPNLLEMVRKVLSDTGFDPHFLELEITENAVMHNVGNAVETLKKMTEMGISLSMDDFGMGYSSLANLHSFPLDVLKIDKSFVMRVGQDSGAKAIVKTIISMGQSLGLEVVAEGVETLKQAKFLKTLGCDQIQGYFISRPVDHTQLTDLLKKQEKNKIIVDNLI